MKLLDLEDIAVQYGDETVLYKVNLQVGVGEIVTLIGPNGSGKSTLVRVALGLIEPMKGRVHRDRNLKLGYVPQHLTIDPSLPLSVRNFLRLKGRISHHQILEKLQQAGVGHLLDTPMQALSGGESRRVLLARALLHEPALLVLDEPTAGMDVNGQAELYRLLQSLRRQNHCAVLLVSHDLHLVMAATDHVVCLNRHVCCAGHPEEVSRHPEYLTLFGKESADQFAVYPHHHDHQHDLAGHVHVAGQGVDHG